MTCGLFFIVNSTPSASVVTSVTATIVTSPTSSAAAPLSAIAARRQQLLGISSIGSSKASTPEVEEQHVSSDNLDVDDEEKASLDSGTSDADDSDSGSDDNTENVADPNEDGELASANKDATISTPQYDRRERKYVQAQHCIPHGQNKYPYRKLIMNLLISLFFRLYLDPQSVSSFRPSRYNVAYLPSTETPNIALVGLHRGEVTERC